MILKTYIDFLKRKELFLLSLFMFVDYIFTYVGIHLGVIVEANKLMTKFMELPFVVGGFFRILLILAFVTLFGFAKPKLSKVFYKRAMCIALLVQVIVLSMHLVWSFMYVFNMV